jgi:hypothetical protein
MGRIESISLYSILKSVGSIDITSNHKKRLIYRVGQYEYPQKDVELKVSEYGLEEMRVASTEVRLKRCNRKP